MYRSKNVPALAVALSILLYTIGRLVPVKKALAELENA